MTTGMYVALHGTAIVITEHHSNIAHMLEVAGREYCDNASAHAIRCLHPVTRLEPLPIQQLARISEAGALICRICTVSLFLNGSAELGPLAPTQLCTARENRWHG
jgi:hypothetical protein